MKTRNPWLIIGIILVALGICAGIFALVYVNIKEKTPNSLSISESDGKIIFTASSKDQGYGYTFKFKGDEIVYVESNINILEVSQEIFDSGIELGKNYEVSYCVNGEQKGANSDYSKSVNWLAKKYLDATALELDGDKLIWDKVNGAEYYTICYNILGENKTYKTTKTECKLSKLQGGDYNAYVVCGSSKNYYLSSEKSNIVEGLHVVHELADFTQMSFNASSKQLTIKSEDKVNSVNIFIGETADSSAAEYTFTNLTSTYENGAYFITINLELVYNNENYIGATPVAEGNNSFSGTIYWYNVA